MTHWLRNLFRRAPPAVGLTGVGVALTASHRAIYGAGDFHEHTWEIVVWFRDYPRDACVPQHCLNQYVAQYAGKFLPDHLSRGEALAADIYRHMAGEFEGCHVVRVDVERKVERLYARWPA